ncbi:RbsD/FucU family protein [Bdellovibrionota bacterium FG-1]
MAQDMLKSKLIHPQILEALACAGHGSHILIADGNYPFMTGAPDSARIVYLNLMPGVPTATQVLEAVGSMIPIQSAETMRPDDGSRAPIFEDFQKLLPAEIEIRALPRQEFYTKVMSRQTALVIASGEQRIYGNILLTIGVVT